MAGTQTSNGEQATDDIEGRGQDNAAQNTVTKDDHKEGFIPAFVILAARLNWGLILFVLGRIGLSMPTPMFWLCWSLLVSEAYVSYGMEPFVQYIQTQSNINAKLIVDYYRAMIAMWYKLGIAIALLVILRKHTDMDQRFRIILFVVSSSTLLLEIGLSIGLLCVSSVSIVDVISEIFEDSTNPSAKIGLTVWKARYIMSSSLLSTLMVMTGGILLGSDSESIMTEKTFWLLVFIMFADLMAELFSRFNPTSRSFSYDFPATIRLRKTVFFLRVVVVGVLSILLVLDIKKKKYFMDAADMNACDEMCHTRTRQLLVAVVTIGLNQSFATLCPCG